MKTLLYSLLIACFIFYSCGEDDPAKPPFPEEIENPDDSDGPDNPDKPTQPDGTQEHPFLLSTLNDLMSMKSKLKEGVKVYFQLENDIDMQGQEWVPLNLTNCQIDFDGKGFTIKNLKCTNQPCASFFGILIGACKNIIFENAEISGQNTPIGVVAGFIGRKANFPINGDDTQPEGKGEVMSIKVSGKVTNIAEANTWFSGLSGGVCGALHNEGSKISQCFSSVEVSGGWLIGGIAGDVNGGALVSETHYNGNVSTPHFAGGIAGNLFMSEIANCYSEGKIMTTDGINLPAAGGILARADLDSKVEFCYSNSKIEAISWAGGIVGASYGKNITINNCVAWNSVITSAEQFGGRISGYITAESSGENCFAKSDMLINSSIPTDGDSSYSNEIQAFHGKSTSDIKTSISWDESIWDLSGELPILKWEK